jgi:hypothetical protein
VTDAEFRTKIAAATTAEALRAIVDEFAPFFAKLPEAERRPLRAAWDARQQALGIRV